MKLTEGRLNGMVHMMTHRQPLTSSSVAGWDRRLRERAIAEGFFASSSLIEKDLTEMWMTVGISEEVVRGRLLELKVESSCNIRPL